MRQDQPRRLFCDLSPTAYRISAWKCRTLRHLKNACMLARLAREKQAPLPEVIYRHSALIRRRLGNVSPELQENKAVNLALAAPKISGIVIGVLLLQIIFAGLNFLSVSANMLYIIKGLIILIACAIDMRKYLVRK